MLGKLILLLDVGKILVVPGLNVPCDVDVL